MNRIRILAALVPALALLACRQAPQTPVAPNGTAADEAGLRSAPATPAEAPTPAPTPTPSPGTSAVDDGKPDLTPPELTADAERGVKGARNLLISFARAIELKEYGQAWALLSPPDQRKWPKAEFAAMFADLDGVTVAIPTGTIEGAAGSSYYTAPVAITAIDRAGRPVRIEGKAVLRRANDVPGASPRQLRWHFETLILNWTH